MAVPKGLRVSINNAPQGTDDSESWGEDITGQQWVDVLGDDLGGGSTHLVGLYYDDGRGALPTDLWSLLDSSSSYYSLGVGQFTADAAGGTGATISAAYNATDAKWELSYDFGTADYNHLGAGQSLHDSFHYIGQTGGGTYYTAKVDIWIDGQNDAPIVAQALTEHVDEDHAAYSADLLAGASDVDDNDQGQLHVDAGSVQISGDTLGGVSVSGDTVNIDPGAYDSLGAGDSATITVSYDIIDAHGGRVAQSETITIEGVNDPAVIGGQDTGLVKEDTILTAAGTLTIADVDSGEAYFQAQDGSNPLAGAYGTLTIDAAGNWVYTLDNDNPAVQALGEGQPLSDAVVVQSLDGTEHTIAIDIDGTSDGLYLVGADSYGAYVFNYLYGQGGDDTLIGGSAFNWGYVFNYLSGAGGDDTILGGDADPGYVENYIYGGSGNDVLTAGSVLSGGHVYNYIYAGTGDDTINGGNYHNYIWFDDLGAGDHVHGGAGFDFLGAYGTSGNDSLTVASGAWSLNGQSLDITNIEGFEFYAGDGDDTVDFSGSGLQYALINGGMGNDLLVGGNEADYFYLADVNAGDVVQGGAGWDYLYVYNGQSYSITPSGGGFDVSGAAVGGVETLQIQLSGGDGTVTIAGDLGGSGLATGLSIQIYGYGGGHHTVDAGLATNSLYGVYVNDYSLLGGTYIGGAGNDTFYTGSGDDTITGGGGNDLFYLWNGGADELILDLNSGHDAVYGFSAGAGADDVINLSAFGFADLASVLAVTTESGNVTTIHLDSNNDIALVGVTMAALASDDFTFFV